MRLSVSDPEALALAIRRSRRSLRELAALSAALESVRPARYRAVSRQTLSLLARGRLREVDFRHADTLRQIVDVPPDALTRPEPSSDHRPAIRRTATPKDT